MSDYINGDVSDAQLKASLQYASEHGNRTDIGSLSSRNNEMGKNDIRDYDRYDTEILAWTNYWNETLKDEYKFVRISPETVKAMMYTESKLGYYHGSDTLNGSVDVMQVLDDRNPAIHRLAAEGAFDENEGASYGLPRSGYGLLKKLYPNGVYDNSNATVNMSISAGIRWLGYKQALKSSESLGVIAYNGGGDPGYWTKIQNILINDMK